MVAKAKPKLKGQAPTQVQEEGDDEIQSCG